VQRAKEELVLDVRNRRRYKQETENRNYPRFEGMVKGEIGLGSVCSLLSQSRFVAMRTWRTRGYDGCRFGVGRNDGILIPDLRIRDGRVASGFHAAWETQSVAGYKLAKG
jgi:hypothetical protein